MNGAALRGACVICYTTVIENQSNFSEWRIIDRIFRSQVEIGGKVLDVD